MGDTPDQNGKGLNITPYKKILEQHHFTFLKSLGQNFLTAPGIPAKIAEGCGADSHHGVLEIGPGAGVLTRELARRAGKVCAVEIDTRLIPILADTLEGINNVSIVNADILKTDITGLVQREFYGLDPIAVANLPYYITTPVITALLESKVFSSITVMVQKEVAARICAPPGGSDYGAFTVFVRYHAVPKILFPVPAGCFTPKPKVDSAVICLTVCREPPVSCKDPDLFSRVVRASFAQRRKILLNCLAADFGNLLSKDDLAAICARAGIDPSIRGERLDIGDFARLADALYEPLH